MNASEWKAVIGIALLYIFRMLGLFMVLPVIGLLEGKIPGATPATIGLALGAYGLTQACLQIPFGLISDRIGRKPVVVGGLLLFIAGSILAAEASTMHGIIIGRGLQGAGAIASTMMALLADLTRVEQRTKAMAGLGISIGLSFGIALVVGPLVHGHFGLSGVFWLTALLGFVGIGILLFVVPTPASHRFSRDAQLVTGEIGSILRDGQLVRIDLGIFLLHYNLMSSFVIFPMLLIASHSLAEERQWLVYLSVLAISFVIASPLMRLADRSRWAVPVLSIGILGFAVAIVVLLASGGRFWWIWGGMLVFFTGFNLLEITLPSLLSKLAHAGTRGTAMGIYSTGQFLGAFCGGSVGGWIVEKWDMTTLFEVNAVILMIWLFGTLTMKRPLQLSSRTLALGDLGKTAAIRVRDALSSVTGVVEVVIIERERVAYLKVDDDRFHDESLENLADLPVAPRGAAG